MKKEGLFFCIAITIGCFFYNVSTQIHHNIVLPHIQFWLQQFKEHAEFATGFSESDLLKSRGIQLADKTAILLKRKNVSPKAFLKLSREFKQYQDAVIQELKADKKDHALELDLLDHMNKETEYAQRKARGEILSAEEEAQFWSEEHEGQAKVMATLVNNESSAGEDLKNNAVAVKNALRANQTAYASLTVIAKANKQLDALGNELKAKPLLSKIPAKLGEHEAREREYAKNIFNNLKR